MSIASAIATKQQQVADAYTAVSAKGGTLPATQNLTNLATAIGTITGGGGSTKYGATADNFLGDVSSSGQLREPSGVSTNLVFTGVRDIANNVLRQKFGGWDYGGAPGNSTITSVSFPDLEQLTGYRCCELAFYGCRNLASISFPLLASVSGYNALAYTFAFCNSLTDVTFPALTNLQNSADVFNDTFQSCSGLQSVSFPALTTSSFGSYNTQFDDMLSYCSNVTVHFPYTLEGLMSSWTGVKNGFGGTNTTVLFDIGAGTLIFNTTSGTVTYLSYKDFVKNNKEQYSNFSIEGSPTINNETGDVSNFSPSSYLYDVQKPSSSAPVETVICFTTSPDLTSGWQGIFYGTSGPTSYGIMLNNDSIGIMEYEYGYSFQDLGLGSLSPNTKYWFKLVVDESNMTIEGYLSTDGITYTQGSNTLNLRTDFSWGNRIGYDDGAGRFSGTIHLADCYIKVGTDIVWQPTTPGENTFTTFYVGDLPYVTYFPSSNVVDYETVSNILENETRTVNVTAPQTYVTLTVSIVNDPVNEITLKAGNIEIPVTKSGGTYTINIANGTGKTIDYSVERTSTTAATTGTITLTGSNQTESITLDPLPTSNITLVGTPTLDTTTGILSSTDYSNYATSDYTLPTDEFEFITKVKLNYDSSQWMTGQGNAFEISGNQLCYWNVNDPYNQLFGAYVPNYGELTTGVNFDGIDIYVFFKYVQSGSMVEVSYAQDWSNAWTKDTVPSNEWMTIGSYDISMYGGSFPITSGTGTMTIGQNWSSPGSDMCILLNDTCIRSLDGQTTYWEPVL